MDTAENNLQPFFVLHKASPPKSEKNSGGGGKTRRKIDLSPSSELKVEDSGDGRHGNVRMEAFEAVWSQIETSIKGALRDVNIDVFNDINQWVHKSFKTIASLGKPALMEATRSFPIVTDAASKQLYTGLVLTKNMEFVDDLLTFEELGLHLKSQGSHVANLSSQDFLAKNGIGGCLRSLLRQFLMVTLDAADISALATWYREKVNYDNPVVIIIDNLERCCGSVLSDFILILSEWALKFPVILIMGVATTLDALRSILPSKAQHHLRPCEFILGTPLERMNAVVKTVFLNQCLGFSISHKITVFMRNYFLSQDGTITSFIRALKIACAQHFSMESLSFVFLWFLAEEKNQALQNEKYGASPEILLKYASALSSSMRNRKAEQNVETLVHGLSELKKLQNHWRVVILCLYEAGKFNKIQLLDLLCESLDPDLYDSMVFGTNMGFEEESNASPSNQTMHKKYPALRKGGLICQAIRKVRDLSILQLRKLLQDWEKHTVNVTQINEKVKELLSQLKFEDGKIPKQDLINISKRHASRRHLNIEKDSKAVNERAAELIENMIRNYLLPVECIGLHELVCFKNVDNLQKALIGDPRRRIQVNLLQFCTTIKCSCCSRSSTTLLPSMHDSSITYTLAQEHGDFINLHDWYQSFKMVVLSSGKKGKHRSKYSPSPKKRKVMTEPAKPSEALIQARFCRAVTELQITGLLRMPSKRRVDYVQRMVFGL